MSLFKNKKSLTVWLVTTVGLLLCVSIGVTFIEDRLNTVGVIEDVAKGLELKDTAEKIDWVVKKLDTDGNSVTRIEGVFDNTLDVPIESLKTILTLYDIDGEELGKQVIIFGTIFENSSKILSFDVSKEFENFDSFTVELEYGNYTTEHTIEPESITVEKNSEYEYKLD